MEPLSIALLVPIDDAADVVMEGVPQEVVVKVALELYPVPFEFVEYDLKSYVVPQRRLGRTAEEKAPMPKGCPTESVVVAPYAVVRPYAKPRTVEDAPPSLVVLPLRIAVFVPIDEAADVVRVGRTTENVQTSVPVPGLALVVIYLWFPSPDTAKPSPAIEVSCHVVPPSVETIVS